MKEWKGVRLARWALALATWAFLGALSAKEPFLLAPMLQDADLCEAAIPESMRLQRAEMTRLCLQKGQTPASLIESDLSTLGPRFSRDGQFELGYTLNVPLLRLLTRKGGEWVPDAQAIGRLIRTLREVDRSVVLYLFATHFGVDAPIETVLARDPANLAASINGPMPVDKYFLTTIYPWTFASLETSITRSREKALDAFVAEVCRLPPEHLRKVRAVTVLGEVHHLFPNFERGMGYDQPYVTTDYGEASVEGFRAFLRNRFRSVAALNRAIDANFADFNQVQPPSKDIRRQKLNHFVEHLDPFAHGTLPIFGWAHESGRAQSSPLWIRIYRNGSMIARVPASLGRQDVLEAKPALTSANVGWRFDMDFTAIEPGVHRIDIAAERADGTLFSLGSRRISIVGRTQAEPRAVAMKRLPDMRPAKGVVEAWIDQPTELASYFFNPLAAMWQDYRQQQVVQYIAHFAKRVRSTCLGGKEIFSHQIAPFLNPSWDATRFAIDASLQRTDEFQLGVNLYGGAAYGESFFSWLRSTGHTRYAVPEFHPMRPLSKGETLAMLNKHRAHGARFISFFLDPREARLRPDAVRNRFALGPENPAYGSDRLFAAVRSIMLD